MLKKRLKLALSLVVTAAIFGGIGATLSLLQTRTESRANIFGSVNGVTIELIEAEWDKLSEQGKRFTPVSAVAKDPCVKNTGGVPIRVFLELRVPRVNVRTVNDTENDTEKIVPAKAQDLFTFTKNSDWTQIVADKVDGDETVRVYAYVGNDGKLEPDATTPPLFESVRAINFLQGDLGKGKYYKIDVKAGAVQYDFLELTGADTEARMKEAYAILTAEG